MKQIIEASCVKCDRCGTTEDTSISQGRDEWGELYINYNGHTGARGWDGSGYGGIYKGKFWLCNKCAYDFLWVFMERKND